MEELFFHPATAGLLARGSHLAAGEEEQGNF